MIGKLNIGAGAFASLPGSLPVFGRTDVPIPTDAGGGFPQDNYQTINKVDFQLNPGTQAAISYAFLKSDSEPGTQSASPYPQYNTGVLGAEAQPQRQPHARLVEQLHQPVEAGVEQAVRGSAGQRPGRTAAVMNTNRIRGH